MADRPEIPAAIKREVRQRCGFGCVLCGLPVFHYDHMIEWSVVKKHQAANLTLLCPTHHDDKTHGRLTLAKVQEANSAPRNVEAGTTAPHRLYFGGDLPTIRIGGNWFKAPPGLSYDRMCALMVDNNPLIGFTLVDGEALLQVTLLDEMNHAVLFVQDGELVASTGMWDLTLQGKSLVIREGARKIFIEIEIDPAKDEVRFTRGRILCNGAEITLSKAGATISGVVQMTGTTYESPVGLVVGMNQFSGRPGFEVNRYRHLPST